FAELNQRDRVNWLQAGDFLEPLDCPAKVARLFQSPRQLNSQLGRLRQPLDPKIEDFNLQSIMLGLHPGHQRLGLGMRVVLRPSACNGDAMLTVPPSQLLPLVKQSEVSAGSRLGLSKIVGR